MSYYFSAFFSYVLRLLLPLFGYCATKIIFCTTSCPLAWNTEIEAFRILGILFEELDSFFSYRLEKKWCGTSVSSIKSVILHPVSTMLHNREINRYTLRWTKVPDRRPKWLRMVFCRYCLCDSIVWILTRCSFTVCSVLYFPILLFYITRISIFEQARENILNSLKTSYTLKVAKNRNNKQGIFRFSHVSQNYRIFSPGFNASTWRNIFNMCQASLYLLHLPTCG